MGDCGTGRPPRHVLPLGSGRLGRPSAVRGAAPTRTLRPMGAGLTSCGCQLWRHQVVTFGGRQEGAKRAPRGRPTKRSLSARGAYTMLAPSTAPEMPTIRPMSVRSTATYGRRR